MKRNLMFLGLLVVLSNIVFAGNDRPKAVNNAPVRTYNWIVPDMKKNQNPMYSSNYSRQRIQKALDQALASKGLTRDTQNPDLLLQFHTYTQRVRRNYVGGGYPMMGYPMMGFARYGWGYPYGWGMPYGGGYGYGNRTSNTTDGTLVLDLVDAKTGDIIWQKEVTGDVSNPNNLDKRINKGVKKLMRDFPVQG